MFPGEGTRDRRKRKARQDNSGAGQATISPSVFPSLELPRSSGTSGTRGKKRKEKWGVSGWTGQPKAQGAGGTQPPLLVHRRRPHDSRWPANRPDRPREQAFSRPDRYLDGVHQRVLHVLEGPVQLQRPRLRSVLGAADFEGDRPALACKHGPREPGDGPRPSVHDPSSRGDRGRLPVLGVQRHQPGYTTAASHGGSNLPGRLRPQGDRAVWIGQGIPRLLLLSRKTNSSSRRCRCRAGVDEKGL